MALLCVPILRAAKYAKTRRDKKRQGNKTMIKFEKPAYNQFYHFTNDLCEGTVSFTTLDGETVELDRFDLFDAFRVVTSLEFTYFLDALEAYANARENSRIEANAITDVFDFEHYAETRYIEGLTKGRANGLLEATSNIASYADVCNACKMYGAMYRVDIMEYVRELV